MNMEQLKFKIYGILNSKNTLLWLEGASYEQLVSVRVLKNSLVLNMVSGVVKIFSFVRYSETQVGLQFWNAKNVAGVLYKWDYLLTQKGDLNLENNGSELLLENTISENDFPPPQDVA